MYACVRLDNGLNAKGECQGSIELKNSAMAANNEFQMFQDSGFKSSKKTWQFRLQEFPTSSMKHVDP